MLRISSTARTLAPSANAVAAVVTAWAFLGPMAAAPALAGPASATPLLFPMLATVCQILDKTGAPACGREIVIGGKDATPACTINPADCVHDNNAQYFPFTQGRNRDGGVHADEVSDLASRGAACLGGDSAACNLLPRLAVDDLVTSKNKVSRLAALRRGTFPAFLAARLEANDPVFIQLAVIDEPDCEQPATGLEHNRVVDGVVTLEMRELVVLGSRRDRFLRAVVTCGVTTSEPDDGIYDFGTSGTP